MALSPYELEQRAERAVRRGELLVALELFESLLAQVPEDERVRGRMESVRSLLQPSELVHRRRAEPEVTGAPSEPLSDAEEGELHAASGRFAEAVRSYQRAVGKSPQNELLRERLDELARLAPPGARADLGAAERLEQATPTRGAPQVEPGARSAKAADSVFRPLVSTASAAAPGPGRLAPGAIKRPAGPAARLPGDPIELLRALLARVQSARKRKTPG